MREMLGGCRMVALPRIDSESGCITPVQGGEEVPFDVERVYFLYDIVAGASRGAHAHLELEQVIVAAMGAFQVALDDGRQRQTVELNQPHVGLYVPRMIWRGLVNFSSGAICVVLASLPYDESDYVRDYDEYRRRVDGAQPKKPRTASATRRASSSRSSGNIGRLRSSSA